ncbi:MAG: hypothetical protein K2X27_06510 [Candidatus Obscuribacterales bacterium]|nr:hypothetical protein [Candidatus Obscuribacterales bacterium]
MIHGSKSNKPLSYLYIAFFALTPAASAVENQNPAAELKESRKLRGKVEEKDRLEHLNRPLNGDPLGMSVKVLPGGAYTNTLQGSSDENSLDSALSSSNFNLPYSKMKPRNDWNALQSNQSANLRTHRYQTQPSWDVDEWGIGGWGVGDWDVGTRRSGISGWVDINQNSLNQERLRADLLDPNFYERPISGRSNIPSIRPLPRLNNWALPPMPPAQAAYAEQNILWDNWYKQISNALYANWKGRDAQPGEAVLRITVRRQRRINAELLRCNNHNESFKKSLLTAVAALNNTSVLDFPGASQKQIVSFESQFSAGTDTKPGAYSERQGELEKVRVAK